MLYMHLRNQILVPFNCFNSHMTNSVLLRPGKPSPCWLQLFEGKGQWPLVKVQQLRVESLNLGCLGIGDRQPTEIQECSGETIDLIPTWDTLGIDSLAFFRVLFLLIQNFNMHVQMVYDCT